MASGAIAAALGAYIILFPGARILSLVFAIAGLPDDFDDPQPPPAGDPYAFWGQSVAGTGFTPIPTSRAGRPAPGRA